MRNVDSSTTFLTVSQSYDLVVGASIDLMRGGPVPNAFGSFVIITPAVPFVPTDCAVQAKVV